MQNYSAKALVPAPATALPTSEALSPAAQDLQGAALSPRTVELYQCALKALYGWLDAEGVELRDQTLANYCAARFEAGAAPATISLAVSAAKAHAKLGGHPSPVGVATVRVMGGIRRAGSGRGRGAVAGLRWGDVDLACAVALQGKPGLIELRDVALLLTGRDGLLRISELVALRVDDIATMPDGSGRVVIKRSKVDQEGRGSTLYLGASTMQAIDRYREAGAVRAGHLFRAMRRGGHVQPGGMSTVAARSIIQKRAAAAGVTGRISGHSLRVGSAQSLAAAGCGLIELMDAGRWASPQMAGHYARSELAGRGAIAKLLHGA